MNKRLFGCILWLVIGFSVYNLSWAADSQAEDIYPSYETQHTYLNRYKITTTKETVKYAFDGWEVTWQLLNAVDWWLTDEIVDQQKVEIKILPNGGKKVTTTAGSEVGPLIKAVFGDRPNDKEIILGCAVTGLIHYTLNWYILNHEPLLIKPFRYIGTGLKAAVVGYNITLIEW